jgi:lipoprotein-anchoring transpeptidase ErfK/SrfK
LQGFPTIWFNPRPVLRTAAALLAAAGVACAAAPAAERLQMIAPGVRILGAHVGGLTLQPARIRVQSALARPLRIVYRGETFAVAPSTFAPRANVDRALASALDARAQTRIPLHVSFSGPAIARYVAALASQFGAPPIAAKVTGANAHGPIIRDSRIGLTVEQPTLRTAIAQELTSGLRRPLVLLMAAVVPQRTADNLGPVIVVNRTTHTLRLYNTHKLVRTLPVAVGQSIYPTPSGVFFIKDKQLNPWWYPPTYDSWAKGLKPVPPGPGNPLGTRWMGLSVPGVGIHGTDSPSSIGYSLSHGCIRMQIPDAEWLFGHVHVGTPVVIV